MKSWAQKMVCPACGNRSNCRSVSGKDLIEGHKPEYAISKNIGGIDFDVYKRVRECAECSTQFVTYEIAEQELDIIIDYLETPDEAPTVTTESKTKLHQFKEWVISKITKIKILFERIKS